MLFRKSHKVIYITNEKSEKKLIVTNIESGKPLLCSKSVGSSFKKNIYYKSIFGVLMTLNNSPIVEEVHAYERIVLQMKELLSSGIPEKKLIGFSCTYTDVDYLTPKVISSKEFKLLKKRD